MTVDTKAARITQRQNFSCANGMKNNYSISFVYQIEKIAGNCIRRVLGSSQPPKSEDETETRDTSTFF